MLCKNFSPLGKAVALHKTIDSRDYENIKELIEAGADVNFKFNGSTPLKKVVTNSMTRCIADMLHAGADVNLADNSGKTPLMYAAEKGDHGCVNLLTRVGLDVNVYVNNVWRTSICYFGRGDDPLVVRRIEIHVTHEEDYMRYVKDLVKSGADVNFADNSGKTPLMYAAEKGDDRSVNLLTRVGLDVNVYVDNVWTTSICYFGRADDPMVVRRIQLQVTHEENYTRYVKDLVKSGADVNKIDRFDRTALFYALLCKSRECVHALVKSGADVNKVDRGGNTALTMAAGYCDNEALMLLLAAGADVNVGHALHIAVSMNRKQELIETLIAAGADVNAMNQQGYTPLMCAAESCNLNLVTYLLRAEVSIKKTDEIGKNALALNCSRRPSCTAKQQQVALLLFAAGETAVETRDGTSISDSKRHYLPASLSENDSYIRLLPLCRETIRKHLISLDPNTHLFIRVPKLGLPSLLRNYLLYDVTLEPQQKKH